MIKKTLLPLLSILMMQPLAAMEAPAWQRPLLRQQEIQDDLNGRLIAAVEEDNIVEARTLLSCGASVFSNGGLLGWTPLMEAVAAKSQQMCELLLTHGANLATSSQNTEHNALDMAAARTSIVICKTLITKSTFDCPRPSLDEMDRSAKLVFAALLSFNRACPKAPKEIRYMILMANKRWKKHSMRTAFGTHRSHPERMPFLSMQVVRKLTGNGIISKDAAIEAIVRHHSTILKPLMEDARMGAQKKEIFELLDPEKLEENFETQMREYSEWRINNALQ